jgi:hypothetical protein
MLGLVDWIAERGLTLVDRAIRLDHHPRLSDLSTEVKCSISVGPGI